MTEVSQQMLDAFVAWDPPCELDVTKPLRAFSLIRAAFFAGWIAAQAIEARRAETGTGSVHESAVPQGCAHYSASSENRNV